MTKQQTLLSDEVRARPTDPALAVPATPASGRDASRCDPSRREMTHEMRMKLDRRIHNQRVALRENWQIVEQRAGWLKRWSGRNRYLQIALTAGKRGRDTERALIIDWLRSGDRVLYDAHWLADMIEGGSLDQWLHSDSDTGEAKTPQAAEPRSGGSAGRRHRPDTVTAHAAEAGE